MSRSQKLENGLNIGQVSCKSIFEKQGIINGPRDIKGHGNLHLL